MRVQRFLRSLFSVVGRPAACRWALSLVLLVLLVAGLPRLSGAQPSCLPNGDVDQNGAITAADALLVFQQALGLTQLNSCQRTFADVFPEPADPDGAITASDALCVFRKALSLPSCLDTLPSSNQPPVADAGADQSVDAGAMVFLLGTASDPDGAIVSHAWTQTGGTTVSLTGSDAATAVFVAPELLADETLTIRLTVTDNGGAQASDEVEVTVHAVTVPVDQASAAEVFNQHISGPVVQMKCIHCHVVNGASGHTRLVFVRASDTPDHEAQNLLTFQTFLAAVANDGGGSYVLNKIQGVGHGGGVQVPPGTAEFANMQRFLSLLGEEVAPSAPVTVESLFDTVIMASPRRTLRRAALIFAGRIPTDEEYAVVEAGDETVLRATIRGLMEGPEFHEFLIRGSNDRLLTDRGAGIDYHSFVDFSRENYRLKAAAQASGDAGQVQEASHWLGSVLYGVTRAPLELIAYVVENDLPYTEILTADYIMANPTTAKAYGALTQFDDPGDIHEFRPSRIVSYYRDGEGFHYEYDPVLGAVLIIDPGPLITDYPHAGILNTTSFLQRYPSTATNRNRARSRWTYYHFLGLDVEKSASRTTDPVALADTNNPTMHNPNCTVCHRLLDPVAGAFQNYGDGGFYRDQRGGLDSLDDFYKVAYWHSGEAFDIEAASWSERQTFSISAWLNQDSRLILRHLNNNWCDDNRCGTHGRDLRLDELAVREAGSGALVHRVSWQDLDEHCPHGGQYNAAAGEDDHYQWWGWECVEIPLILSEGTYVVEVVAWADRGGHELARIAIGATPYQQGDTWYRDMRVPGFAGKDVPQPDHSLQWLAQQIVTDERFAEAAVRFWWPAIMGSEVAEFPEEETDADFDGRLLAASAQVAEVKRLAKGFREGFPASPYTYNLKDLLVEIVLSKWFRTDTVIDTHPVRRDALRDAGAWRLLTPEELARKTAAITGFQWGRTIWGRGIPTGDEGAVPNALTGDYRLSYGGIDSAGITERARDITSIMAGVAWRHAAAVSCPVVMRELYLLPDEERRLFAGIDVPVLELDKAFEIQAGSRNERQTLSLSGTLTAGHKTVQAIFTNDYYRGPGEDRNVYLESLEVRNAAGRILVRKVIDSGSLASLEIPVHVPEAGFYYFEVEAWADQAGDELPKLLFTVRSDPDNSDGVDVVRNKLVELHDKLLGVRLAPNSPDVEAAYRLFVDMQQRGRQAQADDFDWVDCRWDWDHFFFDGILDHAVVERRADDGWRRYDFDWDRVDDFLNGIHYSDPHHSAQAWVAVLAALMMDFRYLYLN